MLRSCFKRTLQIYQTDSNLLYLILRTEHLSFPLLLTTIWTQKGWHYQSLTGRQRLGKVTPSKLGEMGGYSDP